MYKIASRQITFEDFNQPIGMNMAPNNRWIKKAEFIPWDEIENDYAKLFKGFKGHVAKPARLALGALLIQIEYGYSDEETAEQIKENPYLQYFCGLSGYEYKSPFDSSAMVRFRKRFTPERLEAINEKIIQNATSAKVETKHHDNDKSDGPSNHGTLIVDATCAPSQIKYPRDVELLNEAREKLEKIVDVLHKPEDGKKPRMYRQKARKQYLSIARCKKNGATKIRKAVRQQLQYIFRDQKIIAENLSDGRLVAEKYQKQLKIIEKLYEQQKYMYDHKEHSVKARIVNLRQPYLRPIVRGKAKAPTEFGAKLDISVVGGLVRLEQQSFEAYNESELLKMEIEHYHEHYGCYPERVLADKIYRNRANLLYCKKNGIRLSGPALGRPKKNAERDKKTEYEDICDRVEVERAFSVAKRRFGLTQIRTYLKETTQMVIALSILALNLSKVQCAQILILFVKLLKSILGALECFLPQKSAFVQ